MTLSVKSQLSDRFWAHHSDCRENCARQGWIANDWGEACWHDLSVAERDQTGQTTVRLLELEQKRQDMSTLIDHSPIVWQDIELSPHEASSLFRSHERAITSFCL
eukprot:scaffold32978_cov73-Skeletonema_marinoi.AAC.2